jgi:hypothetical protein
LVKMDLKKISAANRGKPSKLSSQAQAGRERSLATSETAK